MQLNKEFVPYNIASDIKEFGFDEECIARYLKDETLEIGKSRLINSDCGGYYSTYSCTAPTFSQCFRFFREKYNLLVSPFQSLDDKTDQVRDYYFEIGKVGNLNVIVSTDNFQTYEEAELACLIKLIEIVKDELGS